jgi:ribonucleoside-diphosphate reductase alpha chain
MKTSFLGIEIDYSRDSLLSKFGQELLEKHYMVDEEKSPQEAYARASTYFSNGDNALAQRLYDYASKKWFMFASPVLSNASSEYHKSKGLPISCFLGYVPDSIHGLTDHSTETKWLSVKGGGVGGHWSDVRSVSDVAPGPIPFLAEMDRTMIAFRQGKTRKGSYAAYLDVSHPDVKEFLQMRIPTGGDINRKSFNLNIAVNITDKFLEAVENDDKWDLIDPSDKSVRDTLRARDLWYFILETRFRTGFPYICYIDQANRKLPDSLKHAGLKINGSNLCSEIFLPTNEQRTAVCCLSSLNLEYYDEWKDTSIVEDLITMLENVLQNFIEKAPEALARAVYSATRERSLGLGTMGFHALLRRKRIAFEGLSARYLNKEIFALIYNRARKQSGLMALEKGCYPDGQDYIDHILSIEFPDIYKAGEIFADDATRTRFDQRKNELILQIGRNAHVIAIAPNANSSILIDTSPSIEPYSGNTFTQKTRIGSYLVKCKYLAQRLKELGKDDEDTWSGITTNKGSIMHLDFLSAEDREIFKTAYEIDQRWIVDHARDRQEFIDQGQSINLFFYNGVDRKYVNSVHKRAFIKDGVGTPIKSLYYLRTESKRYAANVSENIERVALKDADLSSQSDSECISCEG